MQWAVDSVMHQASRRTGNSAAVTAGRNGNRLILLLRMVRLSRAGDMSELSTPPILHFFEQL